MAVKRIDQPMSAADEAFVKQAGRMLRDGAQALDASTRSRLNRTRQKALLELRERSRMRLWIADQWVPAFGAAMVALLVAGLWFGVGLQTGRETNSRQTTVAPTDPGELLDLDMLLADESLEMIEELEFYLWMDAELTPEQLEAELESTG
jgi:hypothetical protein